MNAAGVAWRGDGHAELRLGAELRSVERKGTVASRWHATGAGASFVDLLPAGQPTLSRLRLTAPTRPGAVSIRPLVTHGADRFETNDVVHDVVVDPAYRAVTTASPPWLAPIVWAVRRATGYGAVRRAARRLLARGQ